MATTKRTGLPEVWPSALTGLLSGEQSCLYKAWLPAHFTIEKIPSAFNFAAWKVEHTALVNAKVAALAKAGWKCSVEGQNHFRLTGRSCVLVGKPDIVARKDKRILVVDGKTGRLSDSHGIQVAIYMIALPMVWERPTLYTEGQVWYKDGGVSITAEEVQPIREKLFTLLRQIGSEERLVATPSEQGCKWCDISATDCPQRWHAEAATILTSEF